MEVSIKNHSFLLKASEVIGEQCQLMFKNAEFKFQFGDSAGKIYNESNLMERRS